MAFFSKLLGRRTPEEERNEADRLYEAHAFGRAKLAYERAFDRTAQADPSREALTARIAECCDRIAEERLDEARRFLETGEVDLARGELLGAIEIAAGQDVPAEARRMLESIEQRDAIATAAAPAEISREEQLTLISVGWEEEQAEEYERYGEKIDDALLALNGNDSKAACDALEALLSEADDPRYLHFEVGRARLMQDRQAEGEEALRTFLARIGPDEGGEARLAAHVELARLADERGDFDAAVAEYENAIEALADDPRPYLGLGHFLRTREHYAEAIEVLESAAAVMDAQKADWRVAQELGLAHAGNGDDEAAIEALELVVTLLTSRQVLDLPVDTAVTLAKLHEKRGRLDRPADLYRMLARGSDRANHATYYREAARLLLQLELPEEARAMLQRAAALAEGDAAAREDIERQIRELG